MPKHRVEIDPAYYKALAFEAILKDTTPKALIAKWISENLSPESKKIFNLEAIKPRELKSNHPDGDLSTYPKVHRSTKSRLDPDTIAKIKAEWEKGERNQREIARITGIADHKVNRYVLKLKELGELQD